MVQVIIQQYFSAGNAPIIDKAKISLTVIMVQWETGHLFHV
jgi:hypothetical protein